MHLYSWWIFQPATLGPRRVHFHTRNIQPCRPIPFFIGIRPWKFNGWLTSITELKRKSVEPNPQFKVIISRVYLDFGKVLTCKGSGGCDPGLFFHACRYALCGRSAPLWAARAKYRVLDNAARRTRPLANSGWERSTYIGFDTMLSVLCWTQWALSLYTVDNMSQCANHCGWQALRKGPQRIWQGLTRIKKTGS